MTCAALWRQDAEYALLCHVACEATPPDDTEAPEEAAAAAPADYEVGLVITQDPAPPHATRGGATLDAVAAAAAGVVPEQRHALRLKYYVVLTSKKDLFPKHFLEKKIGVKFTTVAQYSAGTYLHSF